MKKILAAILVSVAMAGTAIAGTGYRLNVSAPSAKASTRAVANVTVTPDKDAGFKMNLEYPTKITLTAPDGVTLEKTKMTSKDASRFDKDAVAFDIAFTAADKGAKTITGEIKFAVCTETTCDPKVERISLNVEVK